MFVVGATRFAVHPGPAECHARELVSSNSWVQLRAEMVDVGVRPSLQDEGGASRDEIAAALVEVAEGRVPKDRIALRELYREIMEWPFVEAAPEEADEEDGASSSSPYEAITPTGVEGDSIFLSDCAFAGAQPCRVQAEQSSP